MMLTDVVYPGVFGYQHILYMLICFSMIIVGNILIKKYVKDEKTIEKIIKISGFVLLAFIICNRISVTYTDVIINKREGYSFLNLIPNTFCGLSSLIFSLTIIFGKKDNCFLHFISYIGFLGGFVTMIYPDFLDSQTFFDLRTITGLLHHTVMVLLTILIINTKYLVPSLKKWHYFPIGLAFMMVFGLFEIDCLHFSKAMLISEPLLSSLPVLTSWYVVGPVSLLVLAIFLVLFEHFAYKKTFKEILSITKKSA